MKRKLTIFTILLTVSLLAACTPKPPVVEPPVVPGDPVPGTPVFSRGELQVDYTVDGVQRSVVWAFDPEALKEIIVPWQGEVRFYVQDGPTLTFALKKGMETLTFAVGEREVSYPLKFVPPLEDAKIVVAPAAAPVLTSPSPWVMPVVDGERVLMAITWPYEAELIEKTVRESMGVHLDKLEWLDEGRLVVTVRGALGDTVPLGLEQLDPMPGFRLKVGQVPVPDYSLRIMPPAEVRAVNTATGRVTRWRLPYYITTAIAWTASGELIYAQRNYALASGWEMADEAVHEFSFSLRDGSVSGEVVLSAASFPRHRQWLYAVAKLEWPENAHSFSHVGASRTMDMVAVVFCGQEGNMLLIHHVESGQRTLYPLQSAALRYGSSQPVDPILWSRTGQYVFYVPGDDNGPARVMAFDRNENIELVLEEADAVLIATSDFADEVIYRVGEDYFLHNVNGRRRALTGLSGDFAVVSWLNAMSFLVTDGEQSLIYDVWSNNVTWQAEGRAIGYTLGTRTVWMFGN